MKKAIIKQPRPLSFFPFNPFFGLKGFTNSLVNNTETEPEGGNSMRLFETVEIEQFRHDLVCLKQQLLDRLRNLKSELLTPISAGTDEGDLSLVQMSEHHIYLHHQRTRNLLLEVEAALARIEVGTFGICEETGEPIEMARLQLIPYTRYSTEGAEIRDTKQNFIS